MSEHHEEEQLKSAEPSAVTQVLRIWIAPLFGWLALMFFARTTTQETWKEILIIGFCLYMFMLQTGTIINILENILHAVRQGQAPPQEEDSQERW